jgi:hypothetical protein
MQMRTPLLVALWLAACAPAPPVPVPAELLTCPDPPPAPPPLPPLVTPETLRGHDTRERAARNATAEALAVCADKLAALAGRLQPK